MPLISATVLNDIEDPTDVASWERACKGNALVPLPTPNFRSRGGLGGERSGGVGAETRGGAEEKGCEGVS